MKNKAKINMKKFLETILIFLFFAAIIFLCLFLTFFYFSFTNKEITSDSFSFTFFIFLFIILSLVFFGVEFKRYLKEKKEKNDTLKVKKMKKIYTQKNKNIRGGRQSFDLFLLTFPLFQVKCQE